MLDFPTISAEMEPPLPHMSLVEYARFSENCLRSRAVPRTEAAMMELGDEASIRTPFRLGEPESRDRQD
jgi:hypothetical protein